MVHATWQSVSGSVLSGSPLLADARPALLRFSHSIGLPPSIPDVVGLAIKVLDVHGPGEDQDLILTSSHRGYVGRRRILPCHDLSRGVMSTVLPYEVANVGRRRILARPHPGTPRTTYADVVRSGTDRIPVYEVMLGRIGGPVLATVTADEVVPRHLGDATRFNPGTTGPDLQPRGLLNRLRMPTYPASQDGRGAPPVGWRPALGERPTPDRRHGGGTAATPTRPADP